MRCDKTEWRGEVIKHGAALDSVNDITFSSG